MALGKSRFKSSLSQETITLDQYLPTYLPPLSALHIPLGCCEDVEDKHLALNLNVTNKHSLLSLQK